MARADKVRHLHDRQRKRQVPNEQAHALERAHLRIDERRAAAPREFGPAIRAFEPREGAVWAFLETRLVTAAVRTTRGPMAERIQFVEFARQTGRQGEVFTRADFVEGQRRGFQFCGAATEPHAALPLAARVELQQPRAPCHHTLADVVRQAAHASTRIRARDRLGQQGHEQIEFLEVLLAERGVGRAAEVTPASLALEHRQPTGGTRSESSAGDVAAATARAAGTRFVTRGQDPVELGDQKRRQFLVLADGIGSAKCRVAGSGLHQNWAVSWNPSVPRFVGKPEGLYTGVPANRS